MMSLLNKFFQINSGTYSEDPYIFLIKLMNSMLDIVFLICFIHFLLLLFNLLFFFLELIFKFYLENNTWLLDFRFF